MGFELSLEMLPKRLFDDPIITDLDHEKLNEYLKSYYTNDGGTDILTCGREIYTSPFTLQWWGSGVTNEDLGIDNYIINNLEEITEDIFLLDEKSCEDLFKHVVMKQESYDIYKVDPFRGITGDPENFETLSPINGVEVVNTDNQHLVVRQEEDTLFYCKDIEKFFICNSMYQILELAKQLLRTNYIWFVRSY